MQHCIGVYAALHWGLCSIALGSMQHCIGVYAALHRGLCSIALRSMQGCIVFVGRGQLREICFKYLFVFVDQSFNMHGIQQQNHLHIPKEL